MIERTSHDGDGKHRAQPGNRSRKGGNMSDSVYKIIELVGTSDTSWEDAARNAVKTAGKSLRELRIAEITKLDMKVENGTVAAFRARVALSFKYGSND